MFRAFARWAKTRINPWTTDSDLLAEFRLLFQVREALKHSNKVIVHFLDGEIGYNFFGNLKRFMGKHADRVRLVVSYHQPGPWLMKILPHRERARQLDLVLTVGTSQFPFFDFLPQDRLRFVPHGVDTNYYCPGKTKTEDKRIFCLTVGHWPFGDASIACRLGRERAYSTISGA